jgi:hypothetical protein
VCYSLKRDAFNDLLGPIQDIWRYEALRKVLCLAPCAYPPLLIARGGPFLVAKAVPHTHFAWSGSITELWILLMAAK